MIGESVNNYRVVSLLGEGGMGAVYLAEHPFMGRKAAIKVLRRELSEDLRLVERFMNEARAANAIRHPNIIEILDVGRLPSGIPYLMMEFLDGESLGRRIARERRLTGAMAVDVAIQTASALHAAHGKGIVHRDLKPDNLFLVPHEVAAHRGERVKVLDFGIAKLRGELSGSGTKTQAGSFMGTPPYMSPEQCRGISDGIDHRTDIYALGIILYEMLAGVPPFVSEGWGELAMMHMTQPPPPLRARNPDVPAPVEAVMLKALAKRPEERWHTMAELEAALREVEPIAAAAPRAPGGRHAAGGVRQATVAVAAGAGGTELLPAPTTLGSSVGQIAVDTDVRRGAARPGWRRSLAIVGGLALLAGGAVAIGLWGPSSSSSSSSSSSTPPEPALEGEPARPVPPRAAAAAAPSIPAAGSGPEEPAPPPSAPAVGKAEPARPADDRPRAHTPSPEAISSYQADREPKATRPSAGAKKNGRRLETTARPVPSVPSVQPLPEQPQPRAKPSCDPNFYLDAQGEKHFKPECF